jgi:hypothetical protein
MRTLFSEQRCVGRAAAGYTVMEVMMAGSITVLVLGALLMLVLQLAKEQKFGLADGSVQQQAGMVEDQITQILRSMNVTESTVFADPVSGSPGCFRRIIVAEGQAPVFPREELYFNPTSLQLIHDPNRAVGGDDVVLCKANAFSTLRDLYFYPSLKTGNLTDSTAVNVVMKLDDDGYSMRKDSSGGIKKMSVNRYFTVKFRN